MTDLKYALIVDGAPQEITAGEDFIDANGIQHPSNWAEAWDDDLKAERGLKVIQAAPPPVAGMQRISTKLIADKRGVREEVVDRPIPLAVTKADRRAAIEARLGEQLAAGATGEVEQLGEVTLALDQRSISDYLVIHAIAQHASDMGKAGEPLEVAFPTREGEIRPTNLQALELSMQALRAHARVMDAARAKRRAVDGAGSHAALTAIDPEQGWPEVVKKAEPAPEPEATRKSTKEA
jgi:hypothetical protein